jgi:DNA-binding CsgD family transcriptional regulator
VEILQLLAQGQRSNDIASCLHISVHTVSTHRKNILKKLDQPNTTGAIAQWFNLVEF